MEYTINKCSTYESVCIGKTWIYIFEDHNMALPVWGMISNQIGKPLNLVTFDTHCDTRAPFNGFLCCECQNPDEGIHNALVKNNFLKGMHYGRNNFEFESVFKIASSYIKNDEQIKTAYDFGYLDSYTVIHKKDSEHAEEYDSSLGYRCRYFDADKIDWTFLDDLAEPIAVDFDLDYFNSIEEMSDNFVALIANLIKKTSVITIAKEPYYFKELRLRNSFTEEIALENLMKILSGLLENYM